MVMSAYNKVNGVSCFENKLLLNEVLRKEWAYTGVVVSDWDSVKNRAKSLEATLDLEMPYRYGGVKELRENSSEADIQASVSRISDLINKKNLQKHLRKKAMLNQTDRIELCREIAEESIVLLKNENILPVKSEQSILVIGEAAKEPFIQGGGSAKVNPIFVDSIYQKIKEQGQNVAFCQGYTVHNNGFGGIEAYNLEEVTLKLKNAALGIIFVGNTYGMESENFDRESLSLNSVMEELIETCAKINQNIVVVLQTGSTVDISKWASKVKGIIHMGYAGIKGGTALANILFGKVSPSGRLSETYYNNQNEISAMRNFGIGPDVEYAEKLMIGYRDYTTHDINVLYPFGYGLAYSEFDYIDYSIKKENQSIEIKVSVKNTGFYDAKETVQVYACPIVPDGETQRPIRELKGFCKRTIMSGNEQIFVIKIPLEYLKYFSLIDKKWHLSHQYVIEIGTNVNDIKFKDIIKGVGMNED